MKQYRAALMVIGAAMSFGVYASQILGGWSINTDASGGITSIVLSNPKTQLNIESSIEIFLDNQGNPVRGHVKFTDGIERDLNFPKEVMSYFDDYSGPHTVWEYFSSVGRLDLVNPDEATIPGQMYGRMTRVITKGGKEYIGKLAEFTTNPDWFVLQIEGSSLTVYRHAIAVLQQMK